MTGPARTLFSCRAFNILEGRERESSGLCLTSSGGYLILNRRTATSCCLNNRASIRSTLDGLLFLSHCTVHTLTHTKGDEMDVKYTLQQRECNV